MEIKARRDILGSVASLLVAPLVLSKEAIVSTFLQSETKPQLPLEINPPAHSVKRRD